MFRLTVFIYLIKLINVYKNKKKESDDTAFENIIVFKIKKAKKLISALFL